MSDDDKTGDEEYRFRWKDAPGYLVRSFYDPYKPPADGPRVLMWSSPFIIHRDVRATSSRAPGEEEIRYLVQDEERKTVAAGTTYEAAAAARRLLDGRLWAAPGCLAIVPTFFLVVVSGPEPER